jgi:hypothetical protein
MSSPIDPTALDRLADALARCLLAWWRAHQAEGELSPGRDREAPGADTPSE